MSDKEKSSGDLNDKDKAWSTAQGSSVARPKGDAVAATSAQPPPVPPAARQPSPEAEGALALGISELESEERARFAAPRSYDGASDARGRSVGARAKDAALDSIRHAKDHAFESVSESVRILGDGTKRAGNGVVDFVGTHAIPLTLLGAGLGWLLVDMSNRRRATLSDDRSITSTARNVSGIRQRSGELAARASDALHEGRDILVDRAHDVVDRAHEVQAQVTDRMKQLSSQVRSGASDLSERAAAYGRQAYDAAGRAGSNAVKLGGDNPVITALIALVLGAGAGLLLPATRRENRLIGASRDRLLGAAERSATELKERVQQGVDEMKRAVSPQLQSSS